MKNVMLRFTVANQTSWSLAGETGSERLFDGRDFGWVSRVKVDGDWSASAVCHCYKLLL